MSKFDVKRLVAAQRRQLRNAQKLTASLEGIQAARSALDTKESAIQSALAGLGITVKPSKRLGRKPGRKAGKAKVSAKRGRKPGKAKAARKPSASESTKGFKNLTDLLVDKVLTKTPMGYDEIMTKAKAAGWSTDSKRPTVAILQAVRGKNAKGRISSAGRGLYVLAGSASAVSGKTSAKATGSKARKRNAATPTAAAPATPAATVAPAVETPATPAAAAGTVTEPVVAASDLQG